MIFAARLVLLCIIAQSSALHGASALRVHSPSSEILNAGAISEVVAWGSNDSGQTTIPTGLSGVVAIAAGGGHTIALQHDGQVVAWGQNNFGQTRIPTSLSGVIAIGAGRDHSVALKQNGTVATWGGNWFPGATQMPSGLSGVSAIAVGMVHTVALKQNGTVVAWGWNASGQLNVPVGLSDVTAIAAGGFHTVALKKDGTVTAWGDSRNGQTIVPAGLMGVIAIAAGESHTVAMRQDRSVVAWGSNSHGQISVPTGLSGVIAIAAGGNQTIALKQDGSIIAWGLNVGGQSDISSSLSGVTAIAAGTSHSVALKSPSALFTATRRAQILEVSLDLSNVGQGDMTGLSATIGGVDASQFALVGDTLPATLSPGEGARLTVRFVPGGSGRRIGWLRIRSTDSSTPYLLQLTGFASEQEIIVESPESLADGSSISWGIAPIASSFTGRTFTIRNLGTDTLEGLSITKSGTAAADFNVSALTSSSLLPGATQTFTVTFSPTAAGARTALLQIASNDADENPFDLQFTGQGSALDISFADAGSARLTRPSHLVDLGTITRGTTAERSFTLRNTSSFPLTNLGLLVEGAASGVFTIAPSLPATLAPNESVTFTVTFHATKESTQNGRLSLYGSQGVEEIIDFRAFVGSPRLELWDSQGAKVSGFNQINAWGDSSHGETNLNADLSGITAIASGGYNTLALKQNGTVAVWGAPFSAQADVPTGLSGVTAIAAGADHCIALKQDGTVTAWGDIFDGKTRVPSGLSTVIAIAAGGSHSLALKQNGTVIAWGGNAFGQTNVPVGLSSVSAIAAGSHHTVVLRSNGTVAAWGNNAYGQTTIPGGLSGVTAITAGGYHTVALKQDGTVAVWGDNRYGQTNVPAGLSGVTAIAAGGYHTLALKQNGTVVGWGYNGNGQSTPPANLVEVTAIAAGDFHSVALGNQGLDFGTVQMGVPTMMTSKVFNAGNLPLIVSRVIFEGPDSDQFRLATSPSFTTSTLRSSSLTLAFTPTRIGVIKATLKLYSNDTYTSPFIVELRGTGTFTLSAARAGSAGRDFIYGPLTVDPQTGLVLQKLTFTNRTVLALQGLRLTLSRLPAGVNVYSSSMGDVSGTVEVIYSRPIAAGESTSFTLCYSDPARRTSTAFQPTITATALLDPEPRSNPINGTLLPLPRVRDTVNGPLLEWNVRANVVYVVEYSDDGGTTWFSAVHRLKKAGTRMMWVDRGQPETYFKPANKAARKYRVKALP